MTDFSNKNLRQLCHLGLLSNVVRNKFFTPFILFASTSLLTGCIGSKPVIVHHVPAKSHSASNNEAQIRGDKKNVSIEGITLENAIGIALARHPDIGRATAVVAQSKAQVAVEKSAWYPTFQYSVDPGYSRYGGTNSQTSDSNKSTVKGTVGASQLIYDFGRTSSRIGAAGATFEKQRHLLDGTMENVAYTMATVFIELSAAQETILAANRELVALTSTRDKISQRVKAGLSDVADLNQADIAMQHAKSDLLTAQTKYDVAAGRFAEMTGIRPQRVADIATTTNFINKLRQGTDQIDDTPSVRAATAEVRAAEQRLRLAKAERFPSISVGVSQSKTTGDKNVTNDSTFVGLQLGGNVSIGRKEKYQIEASQAELQAAKQSRDNDLMTTRTTLGSAETEGASASARMNNAKETMGLSLSARDLYWQQYTLNKRPLTDVLNADRDTFSAESEFIVAQSDQLNAKVKAYTAVGQLVSRIREGAQ